MVCCYVKAVQLTDNSFFVKLQFIIVLPVAGSGPVSAFGFVYNVKLMKYIIYNMAFLFSGIFLNIFLQF